jgi:hypothetical protein
MSAPAFIFRVMFATVTAIAVGAVAVVGFLMVVEPFSQAPLGPPASLGWGDPGGTTTLFTVLGLLALMLVLIVWFIGSPIRRDRRQEVRRR